MHPSEGSATDQLSNLARDIRNLRERGEDSCVLYVGASASRTAGGQSCLEELARIVIQEVEGLTPAHLNVLKRAELEEVFHAAWRRLDVHEQSYFATRVASSLVLSPGHLALASMVGAGYFSLILTSNVDSLIEDALVRKGVPRHKWWPLVVNGDDKVWFQKVLNFQGGETLICKLCGDVYSRSFSVDPQVAAEGLRSLSAVLRPYLARSLLLVSPGAFDRSVLDTLAMSVEALYVVSQDRVVSASVASSLNVRRRVEIIEPVMSFEVCAQMLAASLATAGTP